MESAGWRRNEMNCLVGDCMAGMKRGLADIGRSSRKRWFWMLKKYAPRVFASGKPKLQKKYFAIDGLAAVAGEWKWKMLAGWRRKGMCRRPGSVGLWAASRPRRKQRCLLLENVHLVFSRLKNSRLLFCLLAEFYSAVFGSRCDIPWKDQT